MSIYHKVRAVERVFKGLEREVATFKNATGIHCISGCGQCCKKPDIHATVLEFLPLAYYLFKRHEALEWLEAIKTDKESPVCKVLQPFALAGSSGFCSQYEHRGLICRLFGYTAMLDKQGQSQLVTCKTIKTELATAYEKALVHIKAGKPVPVMRHFYFQLHAIDPILGQRLVPINDAITGALNAVLSYYAYRRPHRA